MHPPMYYWVFHTAASFVPGVFSKWIGLSVNLFFHGINLILLTYLSYLAAGRDMRLPLFVTFVYGFGSASMSGVVFIRMYEMLTTFVLLCTVLHVRAMLGLQGGSGQEKGGSTKMRLSVKMLLAMSAVTYVGFLTQYYYFIFLFFLAAAFCVWMLWRDRNIWNCLRYGIFQGLAFVLAYLTYPAFPGQMFKGQRGAQATANFFNLSNTFERLRFFWDLMNRYVFGGLLGLMLLFLLTAAVAVRLQSGRAAGKNAGRQRRVGVAETENVPGEKPVGKDVPTDTVFNMLLAAVGGYFLAVSKTALLLGGTSIRYQLPIYGIVTLLLVLGATKVFRQTADVRYIKTERQEKEVFQKRMAGVATAFCLAVIVLSYVRAGVEFLYPEAKEAVALAREQAVAHIPVVYIYKPGEEWCIWAVADELMEYDRVYFVSAAGKERIKEPSIADADAVVGYIPKYDDLQDEMAQDTRIVLGNHKLSEEHLQYWHKFCAEWYYCGDGGAWNSAEKP